MISLSPIRFASSISVALVFTVHASGHAQSTQLGTRISLLAESTNRNHQLVDVRNQWSQFDHRDSVVARVELGATASCGECTLLLSVRPLVSHRRWKDAAEEELDVSSMTRAAFDLPSVSTQLRRVSRTPRTGAPLSITWDYVRPGRIVEEVASSAPSLIVLALDFEVFAISRGASSQLQLLARRRVLLDAVELGGR